jgi:hypothetical protein
MSSDEKLDQTTLEIWKKVVDVQMHFNDLELRIRNYAILSLGATMTVAGYALKESSTTEIGQVEIPYASVVLFVGIVIWLCFWFMDRHWYHRLLLGSVMHGIKIETMFEEANPAICLSNSIKEESPNKFLIFKVRSQHRLDIFYWLIATVLATIATAMISLSTAVCVFLILAMLSIIMAFVMLDKAD